MQKKMHDFIYYKKNINKYINKMILMIILFFPITIPYKYILPLSRFRLLRFIIL